MRATLYDQQVMELVGIKAILDQEVSSLIVEISSMITVHIPRGELTPLEEGWIIGGLPDFLDRRAPSIAVHPSYRIKKRLID